MDLRRAAFVCLLCPACGGQTLLPPEEGGTRDSTADRAAADVARSDGGWTQCTAPGEVAVCGGPFGCRSTDGCFPLNSRALPGSCGGQVEPCSQTGQVNVDCLY